MKAEYKRDLQNNYLILEASGDAQESSYRVRMIEQNRIPGLLSFHSSRKDGVLQLYYEITSMQPLDSLFEKKLMNYQDIVFLLSGIRNTLEELQKYLLDPTQIVFDPRYIFIGPGRKSVELCYLPGTQNDAPITMLSEYILKRLAHEDRQAVVIGYGFYQKTLEENFSLQKSLKELLGKAREEEREDGAPDFPEHRPPGAAAETGTANHTGKNQTYEQMRAENYDSEDTNSYEVIHKERKKHPAGNPGKIFSVVHPAVLLSGLFLTAALEIIFYFGYLNLTEAGGLFFLMLSLEMLINRYWHSRKEKRERTENRWADEEEDERYKILQQEMYAAPRQETEIGETRCLVPDSGCGRLRLVCMIGPPDRYPDITAGRESVCVGKIKGESDILLDSPTVSRIHASLFCREGVYYVKDLNSRNGTFCNGQRLCPQEERQLKKGDLVAFAEIEYRVADATEQL